MSTRIYPQLSLNMRTFYVHPADFRSAYIVLQDFIDGSVAELPDFEFEEEEIREPTAGSDVKSKGDRFPYWFLVMLTGYVLYKVLTD